MRLINLAAHAMSNNCSFCRFWALYDDTVIMIMLLL